MPLFSPPSTRALHDEIHPAHQHGNGVNDDETPAFPGLDVQTLPILFSHEESEMTTGKDTNPLLGPLAQHAVELGILFLYLQRHLLTEIQQALSQCPIRQGKNLHRKDTGIFRHCLADGHGGNRYPGWHLDYELEGIHTVQCPAGHGNPDFREDRARSDHPRQMRCHSGSGNNDLYAPLNSAAHQFLGLSRRAMGR